MADPYVVNNHTWKIFAWYFSIPDSYCNVYGCENSSFKFRFRCIRGMLMAFSEQNLMQKVCLCCLLIGNVAAFISDLLARKLGDVLEGTGKNEVETNE